MFDTCAHIVRQVSHQPSGRSHAHFDHIKAGVCLSGDGCIYREDTRVPYRSSSAHRVLYSYTFDLQAGALANV